MKTAAGTSRKWPAPAKLNLFLHVVGRRDDGYHLLQTHFQFLDYCDQLSFTITDDGAIRRTSDMPGVAAEDDLVVRAARLLQARASVAAGVAIEVDKLLPAGGGLGGGSSDAATTLVALNELWDVGMDVADLARLGLELGADVPIFIHGHAAFAEGVGECLTPLEGPLGPVLVVHPGCAVATAAVFKDPGLTRNTPAIKIHDLASAPLSNDCEAVTRRLYPQVGEVLDWMGQYCPARMTGTGACVFGTFDSTAQAARAVAAMPQTWHWFIAERCNESPLLTRLAAATGRR